MQELFSLQININALNHRSSHIVYSQGSAVGKFRMPTIFLICFPSCLSFTVCFFFSWLLLADISDFLFGTHLTNAFVVCFPLPVLFGCSWCLYVLTSCGFRSIRLLIFQIFLFRTVRNTTCVTHVTLTGNLSRTKGTAVTCCIKELPRCLLIPRFHTILLFWWF